MRDKLTGAITIVAGIVFFAALAFFYDKSYTENKRREKSLNDALISSGKAMEASREAVEKVQLVGRKLDTLNMLIDKTK